MPVTAVDPNTALIVIDLQKGMAGAPSVHPLADVVASARRLAEAFRARGLPVVMVTVAGAPGVRTERPRRAQALPQGWAELMPELDQQPGDHLITKFTRGAFTDTGLEAHLRGLGVTQVVLAGIATSSGVEVTAHQTYELGFNTTLAIDAITDIDAEAHAWSVGRVFPKLGETGSSADIIALLKRGADVVA
jgi:nicotinamidase-related amidase